MNTETGKEEGHAGERKAPKRQQVIRFLIYLAGMVILAIGIGTLVAMLGVGRAVALFNLLLWRPMTKAAGLKPEHIVKEKEEE